jgi:lysophospholipase L1-like esterase
VGSALLAFALAEAALRVTGLAPSVALRSPDLETLRRIPGIYAPGQEFTDRVRSDLPAKIRINNLGFRGADLEERKAPGTLRVLALGDSYTFGDHVDTDQTWPALLERDLRQRLEPRARGEGRAIGAGSGAAAPPAGIRRVEVINAGANGFGILDAEALWARAGGRLDPDVVLIAFSPNDVSDMTRPVPMIELMRRNAAMKSRPLLGPVLRGLQRTAVFNALQILAARWRRSAGGHEALPAIEPARAGPEAAPEAWTAYHDVLVRFGARLASEGRRAMLVLYPSHAHVAGEEPFHAAVTLPAWAEEAGLPCLDLLPALAAAARGDARLYLVPLDSHPTAAAHAAAARSVAEAIAARGWLRTP